MAKKKKGKASNQFQHPDIKKHAGKSALAPEISGSEYLKEFVRFRFNRMDVDGPWGWTEIPKGQMKEIYEKLGQFESINWGNLNSIGKSSKSGSMHHSIDIDRLSANAQNRLNYLKIEEDEVFSLRLNSTRRIYGLRTGQWFSLLWYDSNHDDKEKAVCPTNFRET